ncbi:MAG: PHB depolymerase family esterase [Paracoccus sp. (in: a-proteobacteria)]|nr:PHB depolymerase family esterase [Paracoccus sp. (in: a-proteobacteria)]
MIDFKAGGWRPAKDDARASRISAANDLVTRTLAQHGLAPQGGLSLPDRGMPASQLSGMMSQLMPSARAAAPMADLPQGASFADDSFTCAAGTRRYRVYVPASAEQGVTGLVLMLHGCTQTPEDFAAGTRMNALAEDHRLVVVYPHQSRGDNAQSCWNWFSRGDQQRDRGEPAILSGLTRQVIDRHGVPADRVFVAGLSAGAAMAVILGQSYPDLFAAVGAHSGLPHGAARDVASAFAAMAGQGAEAPATGTAIRTIVFHGTADMTVHPSNGDKIVRHALDCGPAQSLQRDEQGQTEGRSFNRSVTLGDDGRPAVEHWVVTGMGHAWSGGHPSGSYTDAKGPDASAQMVRFFLADGPAQ